MKWLDPIRDFVRDFNVQPAKRARGEHEKQNRRRLALREPALKPGFDVMLAIRLILAALLFSSAIAFHPQRTWYILLLVLSALIAGYDLPLDSIRRIVRLRKYDERILIVLVAILAFVFIEGYEGASVILLYQFGTILNRSAAGSIRKAAEEVLPTQAQDANVLRGDKEYVVGVRDVSVGETVVIDPGETLAFDGIILKGESGVDMSALTGERQPVRVEAGDAVLAGSRNLDSVLYMEVRARAGESSAERIMQTIRSEKSDRGETESRLTGFCSVFTPVLSLLAVLYAVLIPLLTEIPFRNIMHQALMLLLIACSASFVHYLPTFYYAALNSAAKRGIVFRSKAAFDRAAADSVVFDQKGTLTYGRLRVSSVKAAKSDPETLLKIAAHACAYSEQPLAKAVVDSYKGTINIELIGSFSANGDDGVIVTVDGVEIVVGSAQLLRSRDVFVPDFEVSREIAWYMSIGGIYAGRIVFADDIKPDSASLIRELNESNITVTLLTGISGGENENNFRKLGISDIHFVSCHEDIISRLKIMGEQARAGKYALYVRGGDNISVPADLNCICAEMNCLGQTESSVSTDIQILSEKPQKIMELIRISEFGKLLKRENLLLILLIKAILLILTFLGKNLLWITVLVSMLSETITILQVKRFGNRKPKTE